MAGDGFSDDRVPIARLMAMAFRGLVDALHQRLRDRGIDGIRPAYGFVLLAVRARPMTINEVAAFLGVSKQAASKQIDGMESAGYVRRVVVARDSRERRVELTELGRRTLTAAEEIYGELEAEWAEVIGEEELERLRAQLMRVLRARNGGELPPVKPIW